MSLRFSGERVGVDDVGRVNAMQDHVHDGDDIGEALFLLAVKSALLQPLQIADRKPFLGAQIIEALAQEARRAAGAVVNLFADLRLDDLDHRANERARRVIFPAVAPGIAHVFELGFIKLRKLVLFRLRTESQLVDQLQRVAQRIAALKLVFDLAENLADLIFDRVGVFGARLEAPQIGEQFAIDIGDEVRPCERLVVIELAGLRFGRGPFRPTMRRVDNVGIGLALKLRLEGALLLQIVEIFEKENPGSLFGVVEFRRAAGLFPEHVVDVLEGLFEHETGAPQLPTIAGWAGGTAPPLAGRCRLNR